MKGYDVCLTRMGVNRGTRASLNLEMALLITLMILTCVIGLSFIGAGVANQYASATGKLDVAGAVSGPSAGSSTDNGDGSFGIGWTGGTPDFTIKRGALPDLSDAVVIGSTPSNSYTVLPGDLQPGDNYIGIIDGEGRRLPQPIHIGIDPVDNTAVYTEVSVLPTTPDGVDPWYATPPFITLIPHPAANTDTYYAWDDDAFALYEFLPLSPPSDGIHILSYYSVSRADPSNREATGTVVFALDTGMTTP